MKNANIIQEDLQDRLMEGVASLMRSMGAINGALTGAERKSLLQAVIDNLRVSEEEKWEIEQRIQRRYNFW